MELAISAAAREIAAAVEFSPEFFPDVSVYDNIITKHLEPFITNESNTRVEASNQVS